MLGRLFGIPREDYPPDHPPVYGCETLEEHMNTVAWDLKLHGLKGRHAEAEALYCSLFDLGGNMTECTEVVLGFPELVPLVFARQDELTARGVDVDALYAATGKARAFYADVQSGAAFDFVIRAYTQPQVDRP